MGISNCDCYLSSSSLCVSSLDSALECTGNYSLPWSAVPAQKRLTNELHKCSTVRRSCGHEQLSQSRKLLGPHAALGTALLPPPLPCHAQAPCASPNLTPTRGGMCPTLYELLYPLPCCSRGQGSGSLPCRAPPHTPSGSCSSGKKKAQSPLQRARLYLFLTRS